ncbi:MAG: galactokinase [Oscillospiraceae bacterium]
MQKLGAVRRALGAGELDGTLSRLKYGEISGARAKVAHVLDGFARSFGDDEERPVVLCSAPGRTEICGNHTDHQHGRVLAGAVDLDFLACAAPNGLNRIRFQSEGWPMVEISLDELLPRTDERESTAALVRGMAGLVKERGYEVAGFDAYAVSEVLPGSGLSSSAACEVLLGVIENCLFCSGELDAVTIAQLGQRAENVYFGKPSGLMDQTASSVGGAVAIDFADPAEPVVRSVAVDLESLGYALCIIDSGASHAALTGEYASSPRRWAPWRPIWPEGSRGGRGRAPARPAGAQARRGRPCRAEGHALLRGRQEVRRGGRRAGARRHRRLPRAGARVRPLLLGAAAEHNAHGRRKGAGHGRGAGRRGARTRGARRLPRTRRRLCRHHPGLRPARRARELQRRGGGRARTRQLPRAEHPPRGRHGALGVRKKALQQTL